MPIKNTLANTRNYVKIFGNTVYDEFRMVYNNIEALLSLATKVPVKAATTANLAQLYGPQTVDGVSLVADDRVLVKDQTDATKNGVYDVNNGYWVRSVDWDDLDSEVDVVTGTRTTVAVGGTVNGETAWIVTNIGTIVLGTTALTFTENTIGAGSALEIQDEGSSLSLETTKIDFAGAGVTVTEPVPNEMLVTIPTPPAGSILEIEDNGSPLTVGATKINFVGFEVSEPVTDEIQVSFGVTAANSEYTPGYTSYTYVTDTQFTIDLVNAVNLFYPGRRLKFSKAGVFTYGVIASSSWPDANDTTVNMTMEGVDTVPTGVFEVTLVSSATNWSPIAGDPFSGTRINDICTGLIGATQWWFAVGDGGRVATSNNGGETWTLRTTVTTVNFACCVYDSINETFWAGGEAGVVVSSTNGTTIVEDTTSIPALSAPSTNSYNVSGITFGYTENAVMLLYVSVGTSTMNTAYTTDQGATWVLSALGGIGTVNTTKALISAGKAAGQNSAPHYAIQPGSTAVWGASSVGASWSTHHTLGGGMTCHASFWDGLVSAVMACMPVGSIYGLAGWTGDDTTSFVNQTNDIAYSPAHARAVSVGNAQHMAYLDKADKASVNAWTGVSNGFAPTANVLAVDWNDVDALFVAVADNGQICRSSTGIS